MQFHSIWFHSLPVHQLLLLNPDGNLFHWYYLHRTNHSFRLFIVTINDKSTVQNMLSSRQQNGTLFNPQQSFLLKSLSKASCTVVLSDNIYPTILYIFHFRYFIAKVFTIPGYKQSHCSAISHPRWYRYGKNVVTFKVFRIQVFSFLFFCYIRTDCNIWKGFP
jgi:hypothetical protein